MILRIGRTKLFRERSLSSALVVEKHPCFFVSEIFARRRAGLAFTYSRYEVAQPGLQWVAPRSDVFQVLACDITPAWLEDRFAELRPNEEMAWHSWAECGGVGFHIPMIDFISRPDPSVLVELSRILAEVMGLRGEYVFYETGRSFHGYFPDLISERAWAEYLGQLLSLNEQNQSPLIDARWVGYSRARGFSALRWSHNTSRYRAMPRLMTVLEPGRRVTA